MTEDQKPEELTADAIDAADRKALDEMAAHLDVDVPPRTRIDTLKNMLKKVLAGENPEDGEDEDDNPPIVTQNLDTSDEARQARRDEAAARKAARSEKRRLRHKKTGRVFVWSSSLAKHPDLVLIED